MSRPLFAAALVALIGFTDSLYLTLGHFVSLPLPCTITHGCDTVLRSSYAMIGPIPLAAYGVMFYIVVGFLALYAALSFRIPHTLKLSLLGFGILGAGMSILFESLQVFVIHAVCQYCLLSALCSWAIAILLIQWYRSESDTFH